MSHPRDRQSPPSSRDTSFTTDPQDKHYPSSSHQSGATGFDGYHMRSRPSSRSTSFDSAKSDHYSTPYSGGDGREPVSPQPHRASKPNFLEVPPHPTRHSPTPTSDQMDASSRRGGSSPRGGSTPRGRSSPRGGSIYSRDSSPPQAEEELWECKTPCGLKCRFLLPKGRDSLLDPLLAFEESPMAVVQRYSVIDDNDGKASGNEYRSLSRKCITEFEHGSNLHEKCLEPIVFGSKTLHGLTNSKGQPIARVVGLDVANRGEDFCSMDDKEREEERSWLKRRMNAATLHYYRSGKILDQAIRNIVNPCRRLYDTANNYKKTLTDLWGLITDAETHTNDESQLKNSLRGVKDFLTKALADREPTEDLMCQSVLGVNSLLGALDRIKLLHDTQFHFREHFEQRTNEYSAEASRLLRELQNNKENKRADSSRGSSRQPSL